MLKGYQLKDEEYWQKTSLLTAWIVNVCGLGLGSLKRRISPNQLLGIKVVSVEKREQTREEYEALKKKHKHLHEKFFARQQKGMDKASKDLKKVIIK